MSFVIATIPRFLLVVALKLRWSSDAIFWYISSEGVQWSRLFVFQLLVAWSDDMNESVFFRGCVSGSKQAASDDTCAHLMQNNNTTKSKEPEAGTQLMQ